MRWEYVRYGSERYHDADGRILGSVSKSGDEYHAFAKDGFVGAFITMESAKNSVERALSPRTIQVSRPQTWSAK